MHENTSKRERLLDLGQGLAVWRVHVDALREQRKNARVMSKQTFDRLSLNIQKEGRLESLPLVHKFMNPAGNEEFEIVSGHHRVRAARQAGLLEIHVLCHEGELTRDEVVAKQLSHNSLNGIDDAQALKELFDEIASIEAKLASGLADSAMGFVLPDGIKLDEIKLGFDYEHLSILFLPRAYEKFEEALKLVEPDSRVFVADKLDFDKVRDAILKMSKWEDVRNVAALMLTMAEIVEAHYRMPKGVEGAEWVNLRTVIGRDTVPESAAKVIRQAIEKMKAAGDVTEKNEWQALEYLAAEYLAGP